MVSKSDLNELRRLVTNSYDEERAFLARIIKGIIELTNENLKLKSDLAATKKE